MRIFSNASAFLKVLKREDGYDKVVEWLKKVTKGEYNGYADTIVIAEIVYPFLSLGLNDEAVKAWAYIECIPNFDRVCHLSRRAIEIDAR